MKADRGLLCTVAGVFAFASMAAEADALTRFWRENDGKTVRRLPVNVMPENVFLSFGNKDFSDDFRTFGALMDALDAKSTYNCITLTLRCNPELAEEKTQAAAKKAIARAHQAGMKVYMDTDPRIARRAFFAKWPDERQGMAKVISCDPTNGVAAYCIRFDPVNDHMSWGSRDAYRPVAARLASALAVKRGPQGLDFSRVRSVAATADVKLRDWSVDERDSSQAYSEAVVTGRAEGLGADEALVVTAVADFHSIDVFSPHLAPFCRDLMKRYRELGADGGMRDEWGFIPNYEPECKSFMYTENFAAAYRARCGRDLLADFPRMAVGPKGDAERSQAAGDYMKRTLARMAELECDFYAADKELFGADVYVAKHCTWYDRICPQNFFHDGLDWWQAKRDWAQGDENAPLYALLGMSKKFGGPVWLNEGYTSTTRRNALRVWTYALCGGRQVYHGLWSGDPKEMAEYRAMPWEESRVRTQLDLCRPENVAAQTRARLASLVTRSQVDCPVAYVFGHESLVDWTGKGWDDYGYRHILALNEKGWWTDAYPASEFALGTFTVDADGYLRVGQQRYLALALHDLRTAERAALEKTIGGKVLRTKVFKASDTDAIAAFLAEAGAVRQPPIKARTAAGTHYPEPDGTLRLIDGTVVRVKASEKELFGLPIAEKLASNGVRAEVEAKGLVALRAEKGEIVAFAGGSVCRVSAPGLSLALETPEDVALVKLDGDWHGIWQTRDVSAPLPKALAALTSHWLRLQLPEPYLK